MTATRVKICGIRTTEELQLAVAAGADAIGLLCAVPVDTPREVSVDRASRLADAVPPFVTAVLVTMGDSAEEIATLADAVDPDAVQVHGAIPPNEVDQLAADRTVIRACEATDEEGIRGAAAVADAVLLDSTDEGGAGGTGRTHDWSRASDVVERLDAPVILAGGLTPGNVPDAVDRVRPFGVDVASGVEGESGKDPAAVHAFIDAVTNGGSD